MLVQSTFDKLRRLRIYAYTYEIVSASRWLKNRSFKRRTKSSSNMDLILVPISDGYDKVELWRKRRYLIRRDGSLIQPLIVARIRAVGRRRLLKRQREHIVVETLFQLFLFDM